MFSWGTFQRIFITKNKKNKKKVAALRLCVCLSSFKETGGFHSVRRSRVPTSWPHIIIIIIIIISLKIIIIIIVKFQDEVELFFGSSKFQVL
jgi:hypothetical protein